MQNQTKLILAGLALTLTNTACSIHTMPASQVKTEAVYQTYVFTYQEETNQTTAEAQFRAGGWSGTTLELDGKSYVKVNGRALPKQTFLGTRYVFSYNGLVTNSNFEYADSDGKVYFNSIEIRTLRASPISTTLVKGQNFSVPVEAPDFRSGEDISAYIDQSGANGSQSMVIHATYNSQTHTLTLTGPETQQLSPGTATLRITRHYSVKASAGQLGGYISASYNVRPIQLQIVESLGLAHR